MEGLESVKADAGLNEAASIATPASAAVEYPRRLRSDITHLHVVPSEVAIVSAADEPPLNRDFTIR
jgi:hypothetical protein